MRKKIRGKHPCFCLTKWKDGADICMYEKECHKLTKVGFSMFSLRHLINIQVTMIKRQSNMDLELEVRFGLSAWT